VKARTAMLAAAACGGAILLAVGVVREGSRTRATAPPPAAAPASAAAIAPGSGAGARPFTPVRMRGTEAEPPPAPGAAASRDFEAEPVDAAWAAAHTELVRSRVDALLAGHPATDVTVASIECRSRWCRLVVAGHDEQVFRAVVESLQEDRGFLGLAQTLALERLRRHADGRVEVDVMLRF
jgi:hypothetical protein